MQNQGCRITENQNQKIKKQQQLPEPPPPKTRHIWQLSRHASGIGNSLSSNPHRTCGGCRGNVTSCCMQLSCLTTNLLWRRKLCNIIQLLPSGRGNILSMLNLQLSRQETPNSVKRKKKRKQWRVVIPRANHNTHRTTFVISSRTRTSLFNIYTSQTPPNHHTTTPPQRCKTPKNASSQFRVVASQFRVVISRTKKKQKTN